MAHKQLTEYQRYQIFTLNELEWSGRSIAKFLDVSHTTVNREIRRNTLTGGYDPEEAHRYALLRRQHSRKPTVITPQVEAMIINLLGLTYSPANIAHIINTFTPLKLSKQAIYNHIEKDRQNGGDMYKLLPFRGRAKRKDYVYKPWSDEAKGRKGIEQRPKAVDARKRFGDLEIDTIIGKDRKGGVLTVVDRATRYTWAEIVEDLNAKTITNTLLKMLMPIKERVKTITSDNGREFSQFKEIERVLGCKYYFARPYASWERGTVERMNREIRMFHPKRSDFLALDRDIFQKHIALINFKPRLCLNNKSPHNAVFGGKEFWQQNEVVRLLLGSSVLP